VNDNYTLLLKKLDLDATGPIIHTDYYRADAAEAARVIRLLLGKSRVRQQELELMKALNRHCERSRQLTQLGIIDEVVSTSNGDVSAEIIRPNFKRNHPT
jgi:hypothetical protein